MNAVDFFSGAGGLTIALRNAGFSVLFSNEISAKFAKTHEYNFPDIPLLNKDIKEVSKADYDKFVRGREIDVLVGGPPCQGFSIFGKRRFVNTQGYDPHSDPRNHLVYEFIRMVKLHGKISILRFQRCTVKFSRVMTQLSPSVKEKASRLLQRTLRIPMFLRLHSTWSLKPQMRL